jgi:transcriptional regulator with XRE-family HTH domain
METKVTARAEAPSGEEIEQRIAKRLARLRAEHGWSLEELSERTGISRASLSRLERSELSPTAATLGKLCTVYGWTLSRLMAEAETKPVSLVAAATQSEWRDPESGYRRRIVSPPAPGLRGEMVEVRMPPGATVSFERSRWRDRASSCGRGTA